MQKIEMIKIDDVKVKSNRYQKLNNEVVQQLAASIREIGLKNPLIVTENKILVSGLHRLSALKNLEYTQVPVIYTNTNEYKNDIEEIDENLVRQTLVFIEKAEQNVRKVKLMIKEQEKLLSTEGKEMTAYLNDSSTVRPILDRLKVSYSDFNDYKDVILGLDNPVLQFMKGIEFDKKIPINKVTYMTLANLPREWQFKFVNELGKNNPNSEIKALEVEYSKYKRELELEKIRYEAEQVARKAEEERVRKAEEERKRIEAERKIHEAEVERKRVELMEKMKKAKAEEERQALIRRQEELERQERARREAEARRLEMLKQQQEAERKRIEEAEKKRREEDIEKKRLDEYYKLYNTTPPALTKEDSKNLSIGEIVKKNVINEQENYRVLHIKDTFTVNTFLNRVEYSDWINSIDDHVYRVADAVKNHESVLLICRNKADMLKVITEVERCVNMKKNRENLA
ncbi:ParB N-terminal domain-containing protein [Bacillus thuringiensis]|nr:ParB N-terminal domain-containing protein [Bacillus thuringiensis]